MVMGEGAAFGQRAPSAALWEGQPMRRLITGISQLSRYGHMRGWRHSFLLLLAWHAVLCANGHLGSWKGASLGNASVVPHAVGAGGSGQGCGRYPAGHHHGRDRQDCARGHHRGGRIPVSAQLPQLSQVDLHVRAHTGWSDMDCINRHE
jgi:hypothetical protein